MDAAGRYATDAGLSPIIVPSLPVYQPGPLSLRSLLAFQQRLVYEVAGGELPGAILIADYPDGITIGRDGSRQHVRDSAIRSRWISRGGGVMLHTSGQLSIAPILPLARYNLTPAAYRDELLKTVAVALEMDNVDAIADAARPGIRVNGRLLAHVGLAVRTGVSCFGITLNVATDLAQFRSVFVDGDPRPMTSLERESPLRVRLPAVRLHLLEAIAHHFGFEAFDIHHHHPALAIQHASRDPLP